MLPSSVLVDTVTLRRPVVTGEGPVLELLALSTPARISWRTVRQAAGNAVSDTLVATIYLHRAAPQVKVGDVITLPDGTTVEVKSATFPSLTGRVGLYAFQMVEAS